MMKTATESLNKESAAAEFQEGSILQLRAELTKATFAYDAMSKANRESAKGQELQASISSQIKALSELEQKTGRFQRKCQEITRSGFDGLANSINQVTRELPNFAQSATIGFMALSNDVAYFI